MSPLPFSDYLPPSLHGGIETTLFSDATEDVNAAPGWVNHHELDIPHGLPNQTPLPNYTPPSLFPTKISALNLDAEGDLDAAPGMNHPQAPDGPFITHVYHHNLDGKVDFFSV